MHGLDPAQRAHLKEALAARLTALGHLARVGTRPADNGAHALPVPEVETSPADKATVRLLNDLALDAAGHQQALLPLLRHALAKFDDDTYGLCEECGRDIGFSRLQARPEARLCIACQTRAERLK